MPYALTRMVRRTHKARAAFVLAACGACILRYRNFVPAPVVHQDSSVRPAAAACGTALGASCAAVAEAAGAQALPAAPSGINQLPETQQAVVVATLLLGLAAGTWALVNPIFGALQGTLPEGWFKTWRKTWPILGAFYMAAGVAHFTAADAFEAIYPPQGTWGFWYLPGSAAFHVAWTGVAEIAGGSGLFLGSLFLGLAGAFNWELPPALRSLPALSALGLFTLTWAVTPANIYMFTHGAQMTGLTPGDQPIPVEFHAVRGLLQVVLLGILWGYYRAAQAEEAQEA
ncbi:unnamed protein product [Symbiodinium natans]|uniref:Uncharacterized protein n=1 Tax=Symbiodinium natans TaxID=878477 RepID=A0A812P8Q8_9DINO|nr:unnamed protein product [Symbiodinium natans]